MKCCIELSKRRYVRIGSCSQQYIDDLNSAVMSCIGQHRVPLFILHVDEKDIIMAEVLDDRGLILFDRFVELRLINLVHALSCNGARGLLGHVFEGVHGVYFLEF